MALITPADLEQHVETDLPVSALQDMIEAEDAEIVRRFGPHDTATEQFPGLYPWLQLSRRAVSVSSVIEAGESVDSDTYTLRSGYLLVRNTGTWGHWVTVEYVPEDQTAHRRHVLIQLCKLALSFSGFQNYQGPEIGARPLDYYESREKLLSTLAPRGGLFV